MTIMDALILLGLILIIFGCIFYIIATIMNDTMTKNFGS
jgi:phage shock protein PspC (stress-responsive transcriptional regulator)